MIWTIIKWFAFFSIINGMATKVTELKNEVEELRSKVAYTDEANMQLQAEIRQVKLGNPR